MDGSPNPLPTFVDLVSAATGLRPPRRKPRARGKPELPPGVFPLVEVDRLFMYVVPDDLIDADVMEAFRAAFTSTWASVPASARRMMREYWYGPPDPTDYHDHPLLAAYRPLILLRHLPASAGPRCEVAGCVLVFPVLATDASGRHAAHIGEMLAAAFRFATRLHWRRVMTLLEDPLAEWERRQGVTVTDEERDRVLDRLGRKYLRQY